MTDTRGTQKSRGKLLLVVAVVAVAMATRLLDSTAFHLPGSALNGGFRVLSLQQSTEEEKA